MKKQKEKKLVARSRKSVRGGSLVDRPTSFRMEGCSWSTRCRSCSTSNRCRWSSSTIHSGSSSGTIRRCRFRSVKVLVDHVNTMSGKRTWREAGGATRLTCWYRRGCCRCCLGCSFLCSASCWRLRRWLLSWSFVSSLYRSLSLSRFFVLPPAFFDKAKFWREAVSEREREVLAVVSADHPHPQGAWVPS